ncbi:hypothetical protein CFC21_031769 [Triticum aestivum]|uniref:Uncharacterized protein n=3 Tax=Triticinae TaxID=1648030 RepID=A0A9R1EXC4_WHEAT|nr:hypothetical protein CFC21_031769 [Triticum aestivum]
MDSVATVTEVGTLISDACRDAEKLPGALISCGVVQAAVALCFIIFKAPGGLFLHHGKAPFVLYYGILVAVFIFGLLEASAGFWVSVDLVGRRAAGKTILWLGLLPIVFVAALGGCVILNMK